MRSYQVFYNSGRDYTYYSAASSDSAVGLLLADLGLSDSDVYDDELWAIEVNLSQVENDFIWRSNE
jgi:hypothetical protein